MNNFKFYLSISIIVAIAIFIISLLIKISNLKDDLLEMEKLKTKKEVAYFALENSFKNLEVSCNKQSEELEKLRVDNDRIKNELNNYFTLPDINKYNSNLTSIFNIKSNDNKTKEEECSVVMDKLNKISKLKYKDL